MADGPDAAAGQTGAIAPAALAFRTAALLTIALLATCGAMALLIGPSPWYTGGLVYLTLFFATHQDIPTAVGICGALALLGLRPRLVPEPAPRAAGALRPALVLAGLAALVVLIWLIRRHVLFDHDFTRDEQMAVFDATIFRSGQVFAPIPLALRPYYAAFNALFVMPIGNHEGWVSGYLPVNAAIRALLGFVMPLSLVSPVLVGVAGVALWRIAVRLWPDDGTTQGVVLTCLGISSQVILTGTAAFAMTTHLALNLVWLALFLRGTRAGHAGALVTGFFATGIHQPVFHPMFVLPFLDLLRRQRRWRTLACYGAGYLAIGLFWMAWPHWLASHGVGTAPEAPGEAFGFLARLATMLAPPNPTAVWIMAANLLRFVAWQHLLLVPLALVGIHRFARSDDLARALTLGLVVTFVGMTILMPPQGHGWGYRYWHGLIGNLCLLAGYGWRWLRDHGGVPRPAMRLATAATLLVLVPVQTWMMRGFVAPPARAAQAFARLDADYVVVDSGTLPFEPNFVYNRPDLANRPRLLLGALLWPANLARLCPGRTIAFADAPAFADTYAFYEDPVPGTASQLQRLQKRVAARAGCRVIAAPTR